MFVRVSLIALTSSLALLVACEGTAGPAGADGADGVDGAAGADGTNGANGADGAAGTNGTDGAAGADGQDGVDGADWPGEEPAAYTAADGFAGGAAYSEWYYGDGGGLGELADYAVTAQSDFTRCKACHGWDGLGNAGSYANRTGVSTGKSSRPDVSGVNLRATAVSAGYDELFDLIERPDGRYMNSDDSRHPDYSEYLTEEQVWNLVKFMREEWVNPNDLYDLSISGEYMHYEYDATLGWVLYSPTLTYSNIGALGDAANGATLVDASCALCHGADGTGLDLEGMTLGGFVRAKPNEAWFKIKFGNSGLMTPGLITATSDLQDIYAVLADEAQFPDL